MCLAQTSKTVLQFVGMAGQTLDLTGDSDDEANIELDFHAAGLICAGVSRMAMQEADASKHMVAQSVWEAEHSRKDHSAVLTECAQDSDPHSFAASLPDFWKIWTFLLCPTCI